MTITEDSVNALREEARTALDSVSSPDELEAWRRAWIGRNGAVPQLLRGLKDLSEDERRAVGSAANALRSQLEEEHARRERAFASEDTRDALDVTAPGHPVLRGGRHPLTIVRRAVEEYFRTLGFLVVDGPEVETEWYNFDALNIPSDHPARDMWDTLWLRSNQKSQKSKVKSQKLLLRTHTSPVQVRYMEKNEPPFRIIVPGRVFRHEATDATHSHTFDHIEGLMVGRNVTLANFKAVVQALFEHILGPDATIRLRPAYFPFTEPSVEAEVLWEGQWLEMMGAGMVNQAVFEAAGYVPGEWQGFAFGLGLDRLAMVKYGIDDIRLLYENDLRFLEQF